MTRISENSFPILHGHCIRNSREFKDALVAASADLLAGRISLKQANAINREARVILKMFLAVVSADSAEARRLHGLGQIAKHRTGRTA